MRAMILAAGRGERMGDLTRDTPKPLLRVAGRYLIEYVIYRLKLAGINEMVINVSYYAEQIKAVLGDGGRYGVTILYSEEAERLETGGGVFQALPLLGELPFLVVSGDVITDYQFDSLPSFPKGLAHLVLTKNPSFHPAGDFGIEAGYVSMQARPFFTFASIGVYRPALFAQCKLAHFPLSQLLFPAITRQEVTGECFQGAWYNVGTKAELLIANEGIQKNPQFQSMPA